MGDGSIHGMKHISHFPDMPPRDYLYEACLLGNYKAHSTDSWHTGTISLSEIGGGSADVGSYFDKLNTYTGDEYDELNLLIKDPNYHSADEKYCWSGMSVITEYLKYTPDDYNSIDDAKFIGLTSDRTNVFAYPISAAVMNGILAIPYKDNHTFSPYDYTLVRTPSGDDDSICYVELGNLLSGFMSEYLATNAYDIYLAISEYLPGND